MPVAIRSTANITRSHNLLRVMLNVVWLVFFCQSIPIAAYGQRYEIGHPKNFKPYQLLAGFTGLLFFTTLSTTSALATVYECKTHQVMWWHDGKIAPYVGGPGRPAERNSIIKLDDRSGITEWQFDKNSRVVSGKVDILERDEAHNDVVALGRYDSGITSFTSVAIFQIFADKKPDSASFLYYSTSGGRQISSGTCHVSDKLTHLDLPPPPVPKN